MYNTTDHQSLRKCSLSNLHIYILLRIEQEHITLRNMTCTPTNLNKNINTVLIIHVVSSTVVVVVIGVTTTV